MNYLYPSYNGFKLHIVPGFDPVQFLSTIQNQKVHYFCFSIGFFVFLFPKKVSNAQKYSREMA